MKTKTELQLMIGADAVAWVTNNTIVLVDGTSFRCPDGWEAYANIGYIDIRFEPPTPEFCNA